jgi:endogenous inhibitor of DNA gyrase (YacG/DUF329 family)
MSKPRTKSPARCPICGKPTVPEHKPFCSSRCARIDLGRWLGEVYRIPGDEIPAAPGSGGDDEAEKD